MKIKTSELNGAALDWAVAGLEGEDVWRESRNIYVRDDSDFVSHYSPSTDWSLAGPIVEREKIALEFLAGAGDAGADVWVATRIEGSSLSEEDGPTPLIAAMRCYVASKLGDEVEVSEELLQGESK